jgi:hypothetical protein
MATNAEAFFQSLATTADIENLVGKTEDLYFDAKELRNESFAADSEKGPLAKAISAFANTDQKPEEKQCGLYGTLCQISTANSWASRRFD